MNSKITLSRLARIVAVRNGNAADECEEVLRLLFKYIASSLEAGESIRVKGFGTFKISAVEARKSVDVTSGEENVIPAHNRVVFVPSKELASAVNAPFDMFETIVVEEGVLEEELIQAESENNTLMASSIQQQLILEEEQEDKLKKEYPVAFDQTQISDRDTASSDLLSPSETPTTSNDATNIEDPRGDDKPEISYEPTRKRKVWPWYIAGGVLALILGCGLLWWLNDDFANWGRNYTDKFFSQSTQTNDSTEQLEVATLLDNEDNIAEETSDESGLVQEEMLPKKDSIDKKIVAEDKDDDELVPTEASDNKSKAKVYDTVSKTRYLTTIAKEHYGNYHLWPYIYKENEKILGHPNRIRPGTQVVVPDLDKYGVDPKNPKDIEKAKKMGTEIYKRYM